MKQTLFSKYRSIGLAIIACLILAVVSLFTPFGHRIAYALPAIGTVVALLLAHGAFLAPAFGAALTVEAPVKTWQRADVYMGSATPCAQALFRAFKSWMMQQAVPIELQLIAISDLTADVNPLDGVLRVYGIYLKKQATATDAFFNIFDDASDDATAGDAKLSLPLFESGKETMAFFPDGIPLGTGLVIGAYTALIGSNGSTPTTTGDGPNGFLLVGA